jgi:UDP-GlcNAc:undecaprenyl-phosphate GlcNAc-1-phosphate transferase
MREILLPLLAGLGASLALTPAAMLVARRIGVVDRPVKDRWNRREVPLLGGAAIFAGFLLAVLVSGGLRGAALAMLPGAAILFLTGIIDDVRGLRPSTKLVAQIVAAALLVIAGVEARFTDERILTISLTILWVVGITNALNLIDNMDGLCAGVGTLAAGALAAYALRFSEEPFPQIARMALALAGAQAGFLVYNVNPARVFMGDAGALTIGYLLAALSIAGTYEHAGSLFLILAVPVFVLAVPILDTTFVTVMRRLAGRRVTQGGADHVSHRLVALGMSERRAVFFLWSVCATLAGLGVLMSYLDLLANLFIFGVAIVAVVILALVLGGVAIYRPVRGPPEAAAGTEEIRRTFGNYLRGSALVLLDTLLTGLAYTGAYLVKFEGHVPDFDRARLLESLPVVIIARTVFFLAFGLYRGFWRYFGVRDLLAVLRAVIAGSAASVIAVVLLFRFEGYSRALFVVDAMIVFLLVSGSRFLFRALFESRSFPDRGRRVLILGAGDAGELTIRALRTREGGPWVPVGFLDGDGRLRARRILGVPVLGPPADFEKIASATKAEELTLALSLTGEEVAGWRARARAAGLSLSRSPVLLGFPHLDGPPEGGSGGDGPCATDRCGTEVDRPDREG